MPTENRLLARLARQDRLRVERLCEDVPLKMTEVLSEPQTAAPFVYFPITGFVSVILQMDGAPDIEVAMVGEEGMLGAELALGRAALRMHLVVQGGGQALRMSADSFERELQRSQGLRGVVNAYLHITMAQLATAAGCLGFHQVEPRLARWLLMTQDRARANSFDITQEFLAFMLGVRRVSITNAATALQRRGLINYRRGAMTVLDRRGLRACACSCYEVDRRTYNSALP